MRCHPDDISKPMGRPLWDQIPNNIEVVFRPTCDPALPYNCQSYLFLIVQFLEICELIVSLKSPLWKLTITFVQCLVITTNQGRINASAGDCNCARIPKPFVYLDLFLYIICMVRRLGASKERLQAKGASIRKLYWFFQILAQLSSFCWIFEFPTF